MPRFFPHLAFASLLFLAAVGAPRADEPVLRIYDVGFLTMPRQDRPGPHLESGPFGNWPAGAVATESEAAFLTGEEIVDTIRTNFFEDSWADKRHNIVFEAGTLIVVNQAPVHEVIARCLDVLRARAMRQVQVEAELLELSPATYDALAAAVGESGLVLSAQSLAALESALQKPEEARVIQTARVTAFPGQRVHAFGGTQQVVMMEYEVEIAQQAAIADPVPGIVDEGCVLDVRPLLEFGDKRATLHLRFEWQTLRPPVLFDPQAVGVGPLHLISVAQTAVETSLTVPLGGTAVAGLVSAAGRERGLALLVRPALTDPDSDVPATPPSAEKRQFRLFDAGFLLRSAEDRPGPELGLPNMEDVGVSAAFSEVAEGISISGEALVDLIRRNVDPDSWENSRNRIWLTGSGQLGVVQVPEVLDKVQAYFAALARDRGRAVTVEFLLLNLGGKYAGAGLRSALPATGTISAETVKALRAEARSGGDAKVLVEAAVSGFNRQRFHLRQVIGQNFMRDYDVEIATDSRMYDPIVGQFWQGAVLEVMPMLAGDGSRVVLDLAPAWVRASDPEVFDMKTPVGARIHLPRAEVVRMPGEISVPVGAWRLAGMVSDPTGAAHRALLVRARVTSVP